MSDPIIPPDGPGLTVTAPLPGGGVIVASDALLARLDSLDHLATHLRASAAQLSGTLHRLDPTAPNGSDLPVAAHDARHFAETALHQLLGIADNASTLAKGVRTAMLVYERVDEVTVGLGHQLEESLAELAGEGFRTIFPFVVLAGGVWLAGRALAGHSPATAGADLQSFLKRHGRLLNNPLTVRLVRDVAADSDGFAAGFDLESPPVAAALRLSGATGVSSSANEVVALGRRFGFFEPTGESVHKSGSFEGESAPTSLAQRAKSFPGSPGDPNDAQIRVDRYVEPGKPDRFDVYIGGTVTFDPKTGTEPFDLQSDLAGVGLKPTASAEAVVDAMHRAGVTPQSPVILNGYSQGGLVASTIAASGKFDVQGVVTFGAPSAPVHVPASIPVLTVRNSEDIVPATSGYDVNPHAVVVTRDAFAHQAVPSDVVVAGHDLRVYQQTAAVVDGSDSDEVRGVLDPLNRFGAGATRVDSTLWTATRVPPGR
jgi:hypothetical protein